MELIPKEAVARWPIFDELEQEALIRTLNAGRWGSVGPEVEAFEDVFRHYLGAKYGACTVNATNSTEIVLRTLGISHTDEVIIPSYSYFSTASAIMHVGAKPVIADIDPSTMNISQDSIERLVADKTKAIIIVHIGGRSCNMDVICEIAKKHNIHLIEDCAHAHGSEWRSKRLGTFGIAGIFSFQRGKVLTCGEGGFVSTNDDEFYEELCRQKDCGRIKNDYRHFSIGTNSTMTEFQAALLSAQIKRLDTQNHKRQRNAITLSTVLSRYDEIELLKNDERITSNAYYAFIFKYKQRKNPVSRDQLIRALKENNIPAIPGYLPINKQPAMQTKYACPNSDYLKDEIVWIKHHFLLSDESLIAKTRHVFDLVLSKA